MEDPMKHLALMPSLLATAIYATSASALGDPPVSHKSPPTSVQESAAVEGADNFYKRDKVTIEKVTFNNQYGMKVAGNLFVSKAMDRNSKSAAIVVGHPMGAVKEQSSNLHDRTNLIPFDKLTEFFTKNLAGG
jgi:uncharacterized protein